MLFGPAYKGIALATTTAIALAETHDRDVPLAFNRKEAKNHGEGGVLIGAPLKGRVLIVDDVITRRHRDPRVAGTDPRARRDRPAGVLIALDRQERGQGALSAAQEVAAEFGIPVIAIARLDELLALVDERPSCSAHRRPLAGLSPALWNCAILRPASLQRSRPSPYTGRELAEVSACARLPRTMAALLLATGHGLAPASPAAVFASQAYRWTDAQATCITPTRCRPKR